MGYLFNSGTGFLANAVTTASNVRSYLINKGGYLVDTIRVGISDFGSRVLDDGGTIEAYDDASASYRDVTKTLYDQASIVLFPSGYKDNLLYSHKPTDGSGDFSYTRGTDTGTVIGEDGYIKKERVNLLTQSNTFSSSDWSNERLVSPIQTGFTGYDGSSDAWKLIPTTDNNTHRISQLDSQTGVKTFSVYLKQAGYSKVRILAFQGNNNIWEFDLDAGVTIGNPSYAIEYKATNVGNDWWRLQLTTQEAHTAYYVFVLDDLGNTTFAGDGVKGILIQDVQLEQGLVATDYIETTTAPVYAGITDNIPRLDYSTGTACLLLEPQRTNYIASSEYISNWQLIGSVTATANYGISPEGVKNSTRLVFTGTSQEARKAATSVTGCVASIYVKGTSGETIKFGSTGSEELFTLNGSWQRIDKYNSSSPTNITINTYSGATAREIEVWGAQVEQGSYPTSYIPTYSSSQTRAADLASHTGTILSDDDFTLFIHTKAPAVTSGSDKFFVGVGYLNLDGSGNLRFRYDATNYTSSEIDVEQEFKFLIRKDSTDMKIYINGQLRHTITVLPTGLKNIDLEWGLTRKFMTYTTALDTAVCESLTAL